MKLLGSSLNPIRIGVSSPIAASSLSARRYSKLDPCTLCSGCSNNAGVFALVLTASGRFNTRDPPTATNHYLIIGAEPFERPKWARWDTERLLQVACTCTHNQNIQNGRIRDERHAT